MRGVCGLAVLTGLLVCRLAAAAVDVRLRNVETSTGPAYTWQVTSSIGSPQNITLYGNQTASTTFNVNVKRTPAGSGYTISGRVVITNTPDSYEVVSIDSVRMLLGPGLPWFGPTPRALDCKQREIMPGDSVSCAFRLHVSNTATSSIRPSVDIKGQRQPVQGESISVTFPAEAAASSSGSSNSNCAVIRDRIVADGAEQGMQLQGAGSAAELLGGGVRVCAESASFSYTAAVGPFRDTEDVCGSYQYKNAPTVDVEGFGSASITPAAGSLFIGGCRQKDMLGMLKPLITISKLQTAKLANTTWAITGNSSLADGSEPFVHYNATAVVRQTIHISKGMTAPVNALVGEVTITNNQLMPYPLGGVRLVITRSSDSTSSSGEAADAPQQLFVDAHCPVSSQGNVLVPPQLVTSIPGTVRCMFHIPVDASFEAGTIQAQYKTVILNSYADGVDSGPPTPYTFSSNITEAESASCVDIWVKRIVNESEVAEADLASNPGLGMALTAMKDHMYTTLRSAKYVSGRMPPVRGSFLAVPYTVCANATIEWAEQYGPYTSNDCGTGVSLVTVTATDSQAKDLNLAQGLVATPLTINGCGFVPQVSIADIRVTAKKQFNWNVEKVASPESLSLKYDQQGLVKYDILYTRSQQITGYKLQALVGITNPHAIPLSITRVAYSISRPQGKQPLTGIAVCNETYSAASQAAAEVAAAAAAAAAAAPMPGQAPATSDVFGMSAAPRPVVKNAVTSFTLPPSPAAVAAAAAAAQAAAAAAAAAAAVSSDASKSGMSRFRLFNTQNRQDSTITSSSSSSDASQQEQLPFEPAVVPAGAPTPYYCSFVVPTPDDFAAHVSVRVLTNKGEETETVTLAPVNWTKATLYETGRCVHVSSSFLQTLQQEQATTLIRPASVSGSMPPNPETAVRVCDPVTYSFRAMYGPFKETQCGVQQAIIQAAVQGESSNKSDNSVTIINVSGCPDALPLLSLAPATATQIVSGYEWSIERSMKPLQTSNAPVVSAAGPCPGLNTAPLAAVSVQASSGSVALFNQTVTFRRSQAIPFVGDNQRFQVKGVLNIVNPGDNPLWLTNVDVKLTQPGVIKPVITRVYCSMSNYKPSQWGKGLALVVPPAVELGGKPLTCTYSAMLTSQADALLTASATTAPDGRWAKSSNSVTVALKDVKPLTVGGCIKAGESQSVVQLANNNTLAEPGFVGSRVPKTPEQLCFTKTYQVIGQLGPLKAVQTGIKSRLATGQPVPPCGAVRYRSVVTAEPTTGFQGKLVNAGELLVNIVGCQMQH